MSEHRPEVADVIRNDGAKYLELYRPSREQYQVLNALADCRTSALGGHVKRCQSCGHEVVVYNSCRNRHCPKCQGAARAAWLEAREREVLDVEYFHVVFTVPHELAPLALQNPRILYGLLFRAASETLLTLGRDAKCFGAELGALAILHTWGQSLHLHPHLHCVVPGGGLSLDGERWIHAPRGFFLPVRVLARLFRGKFIAHLQHAFEQHRLQFYGQCRHLTHPHAWNALLDSLQNKDWVVYAKPPFGGPERVLKYLARYTHRVAISNQRLVSSRDGKVSFRYKDYARGHRHRTMTLDSVEFLRRFLLHVLPKGFVRIRYYGFLANRHRNEKLQTIRALSNHSVPQVKAPTAPSPSPELEAENSDSSEAFELCPECNKGWLVPITTVSRAPHRRAEPWSFDSS